MIWTQKGCVLYVCAKFEADCCILSKVIRGSRNFEFGSRDPKPRPFWGHFMIQTQYGPDLCTYAKFEEDISIRSKVIRGSQNFEIRSSDPGHAHFGVAL